MTRRLVPATATEEMRCHGCRFWDAHDLMLKLGDCRAPGDHRYSRFPMGDGTYALFDAFGPEQTERNYTCGAWQDGSVPPTREDLDAALGLEIEAQE